MSCSVGIIVERDFGDELVELAAHETEHFLAFQHFPWFRDAPVRAVVHVERPQPHQLYWPELDVDPHVGSISHPDKYPLVSRPSA